MINHIDLGHVLHRTVCDLYSDLVTRPTGAAVRLGIEQQLEEVGDRTLTVIDFTRVGLLDFSCADEIVAKLLLRYSAPASLARSESPLARNAYFLFRGVSDAHLDAIETVLERHELVIVAEGSDGELTLVGTVGDGERRAWAAMCQLGRGGALEVSRAAGLCKEETEELLSVLCRRGLVMTMDAEFVAIGARA